VTRLPAPQRRQTLLEAARSVFIAKSYAGATTADIAREAGVSEPILYRHFASKRDLYLACLDDVWTRLRAAVEEEIAQEPDAGQWVLALPKAVHRLKERRLLPPHFWLQALSEAGADPVIRRHIKAHMRDVHAFVRDIIVRAQEAGGVPKDRDPDGEAWINVGIGVLRAVEDRLGGVLPPEHFAAIAHSRYRWLTGRE
jgi:TetR/AcrR family transcriptional regulator